jgi:hypothetical protein
VHVPSVGSQDQDLWTMSKIWSYSRYDKILKINF